jgi:hypothetical protein
MTTQQATCAAMIDPRTAQRSPNPGRSPEKLRLRHLAARAIHVPALFGLAWRAGTEQNRLRKPASGESRLTVRAMTDRSTDIALAQGFSDRPATSAGPTRARPRGRNSRHPLVAQLAKNENFSLGTER